MSELKSIITSSQNVELSESDDGLKMYLTANLGFLNHYNLNNVCLLNSEYAEESIKSLVNMPLKAKYRKDIFGDDNFGSHEAYKDMDGKFRFATERVGTHYETWIQETEVSLLHGNMERTTLPCIFARAVLWKEECPEYARTVKKLYSEGRLGTSWELIGEEIGDDKQLAQSLNLENPRAYSKWRFIANTMIGVRPAYGDNSRILEVAQEDGANIELADALAKDMLKNINENFKLDTELPNSETSERRKLMEKTLEELQEELSAKNTEIEAMKVTIQELSTKVSEIEKSEEDKKNLEKSELQDKLVKASESIDSLTKQVEELSEFKVKLDAIEAEKAETEKTAKIEELKTLATSGDYITKEELETSEEIKALIEACDEQGIKILKAERIIASVKVTDPITKEKSTKTEMSEETKVDADIMSAFLK